MDAKRCDASGEFYIPDDTEKKYTIFRTGGDFEHGLDLHPDIYNKIEAILDGVKAVRVKGKEKPRKPSKYGWTHEQDNIVKKAIKEGVNFNELIDVLDKKYKTIYGRAVKLGYKSKMAVKRVKEKKKEIKSIGFWTPEQDAIIKSAIKAGTKLSKLVEGIGRTYHAIYFRAIKLGYKGRSIKKHNHVKIKPVAEDKKILSSKEKNSIRMSRVFKRAREIQKDENLMWGEAVSKSNAIERGEDPDKVSPKKIKEEITENNDLVKGGRPKKIIDENIRRKIIQLHDEGLASRAITNILEKDDNIITHHNTVLNIIRSDNGKEKYVGKAMTKIKEKKEEPPIKSSELPRGVKETPEGQRFMCTCCLENEVRKKGDMCSDCNDNFNKHGGYVG